jgi:hypothetical protein
MPIQFLLTDTPVNPIYGYYTLLDALKVEEIIHNFIICHFSKSYSFLLFSFHLRPATSDKLHSISFFQHSLRNNIAPLVPDCSDSKQQLRASASLLSFCGRKSMRKSNSDSNTAHQACR